MEAEAIMFCPLGTQASKSMSFDPFSVDTNHFNRKNRGMAEIEIGPLTDRFSDDEIAEIARKMEKSGAPSLPRTDESQAAYVADDLDDDALTEFMDRLDAHDLAADVYLPVEFDGVIEIANFRVASLPALIDVLDEVRDELDLADEEDDDDEDGDDDDEDDNDATTAELRVIWRHIYDGAVAATERKLPLHVKS